MECRIALFSSEGGEYQMRLRDDCNEAARRYGFPMRSFVADNDAQKQVVQIETCLREPPDRRPTVVIVSPVREIALLSVAHAAARAGVGWVVLLRWSDYVLDLREAFPHLPIFVVMPDQTAIGRIQAQQFKALLRRGGEVVYIRGPLGTSSAVRRFEAAQQELKGSPITMFTLTSDWTLQGGAEVMGEWIRIFKKGDLPRFIVGAQNDAMAMGARSVLEKHASQSTRFLGCDGSPGYGQRLVNEGKLTATVIMPLACGKAVAAIASMQYGGARPEASIVLQPASFPQLSALAGST